MRFPQAPDLDGGGLSEKVRQVLQRWMNEVRVAGNSIAGATGTVTNIATTLPITGGPITTTGTVAINNFTGDSGAGGLAGAVPPPAAGDAAAGKFLKASGGWAVPPSGGTLTVQDEGIVQSTTVTTMNFVGTGVTASGAGATETVTVPGAGQSGGQFNWGLFIAGQQMWPQG